MISFEPCLRSLRGVSATFTLLPNSGSHCQVIATNLPSQGQLYSLTEYVIYLSFLLNSLNECKEMHWFLWPDTAV